MLDDMIRMRDQYWRDGVVAGPAAWVMGFADFSRLRKECDAHVLVYAPAKTHSVVSVHGLPVYLMHGTTGTFIVSQGTIRKLIDAGIALPA